MGDAGEPAVQGLVADAAARHEHRSLARGFRRGSPRVGRNGRQYWCGRLDLEVDVPAAAADPDAAAIAALRAAAARVDPASAPESALAVALAVLQAGDAELRTWIVDADFGPTAPRG